MIKTIVFLWMTFGILQNESGSDVRILVDSVKESHCLCGQVRLYGDEGVAGFLIEELTPDLNRVTRSTYSGKKGYFEFPKASSKGIHYICVSRPLYQTICYKVKISKKEKEKLIITMYSK